MTWGSWRLSGHHLIHDNDPDTVTAPPLTLGYDLLDCTSSAEVLDMISHFAHKSWATDEILAGLVRAVDDILQPQHHLCPSGQDRRITPSDIQRMITAARAWL